MVKYYTRRQKFRKDRSYEVHGDVITPVNGDYFTNEGLESAIKALKKIGKEKGIRKKVYFEKKSAKKRREEKGRNRW